jgi:hypothetical protein
MPRTTIRSEDITDLQVKTADMAVDPTNASNLSSGSVPLAQLDNAPATDVTGLQDDIALIAFQTQANGSLARYNLVDQSVDSFEDASGIASNTGGSRNAPGNYYSGEQTGATLTATGGAGGGSARGNAAGGTGTNGATNGTGGTGGYAQQGGTGGPGGNGTNGAAGGAGGGSGGGPGDSGGPGGNGLAGSFTGGGGGGGADRDGTSGPRPAGGTGFGAGGGGGSVNLSPEAGGNPGGGAAGITNNPGGSSRLAGGGGGGGFGAGGGGSGDAPSSPNVGGGAGASGAVVFSYTDSGSNPANTQYYTGSAGSGTWEAPAGSTNLTVYVIGGGGGGGWDTTDHDSGNGGAGGGLAVSSLVAGAAGTFTYTVGAGGAGNNSSNGTTAAASGTSSTCVIPADATDYTLISNSQTALVAPTKGDLVFTYTDAGGVATYTGGSADIKAYISRDGAAYSSAVTLTKVGTSGGQGILTTHDVDISGITSGTAMRYKIVVGGQGAVKMTRINAVSLGWS